MSVAENFIPYEQIKPLLKPGMLGIELAKAILEHCGLPLTYTVLARNGEVPLREAIKEGLYIYPPDYREFSYCSNNSVVM